MKAQQETTTDPFAGLIGQSPSLGAVLRAAQIVAATDASVLIRGETGTGKELLARALHDASPRANGPFVAINCAALPEGLAESELFGHRRGAFTDARADRRGYIRNAEGGTLFLDEIGELSLASQARLLRFVELGECQAVGETRPVQVDVRIVTATNRDLLACVEAGTFRRDLFYRLEVVPLELPPLRERASDIPALTEYFLDEGAARLKLPRPHFNTAALRSLREHAWPGNVRELRNLCERLCVLLSGQEIGPHNLPLDLRPATNPGLDLPAGGIQLAEVEAEFIRQALSRTEGNKTRAARLLGLSRDTLLYRLKKHAILD